MLKHDLKKKNILYCSSININVKLLIVTSDMIITNWQYDRKRFASFLNCTVATHFKNQSTESFFGLLRHIGSIAQISLNSVSIRQISTFARVF